MKHILAVLLSVLVLFSLSFQAGASVASIAETSEKVVFKDENWAYEKVDVYGYELDEYLGSETIVELPWSFAKEYVTAIGDYACLNNQLITEVDTTSVLETIGDYSFNGCANLSKITLYDSVTSLGVASFYGDHSLTDINLQDSSVSAVPEYCFAECGIVEMILPNSCNSIGDMAYYNCKELTKIVVPRGLAEISKSAFTGCDDFTIYCYTDSFAHEYAEENSIPYVLIDAPVEVTFILGDADGDSQVTILDATKIQRILVGLDEDKDGMISLRGNVNNEEKLSIMHATKIQRWIADYAVDEPIGTEVTRTISYEDRHE